MTTAPRWEDPRRVLARHGLAPKRGYSQNFLVAKSAVEGIADAVCRGVPVVETVVELGPGVGTLTAALLRRGARVIAIEQDREMIEVLRRELSEHALEVRAGDAATTSFESLAAELGGPIVITGNLPYAVTGAIFRNLGVHREHLARVVVMIQREVRDRLLSAPGTKAYGALTVFVQAAFTVRHVLRVPAGAFHPIPKVESAVVSLTPRSDGFDPDAEPFRSLVRAAFEQRRKTLRNALGSISSGDRAVAALEAAGIDPRARGETLAVEDFARLAQAWSRG